MSTQALINTLVDIKPNQHWDVVQRGDSLKVKRIAKRSQWHLTKMSNFARVMEFVNSALAHMSPEKAAEVNANQGISSLLKRYKRLKESQSCLQRMYTHPLCYTLGYNEVRKLEATAEELKQKAKRCLEEKIKNPTALFQEVEEFVEKQIDALTDKEKKRLDRGNNGFGKEMDTLLFHVSLFGILQSNFRRSAQKWEEEKTIKQYDALMHLAYVIGIRLLKILPEVQTILKENTEEEPDLETLLTEQDSPLHPSLYRIFFILPVTYCVARGQLVYEEIAGDYSEDESVFLASYLAGVEHFNLQLRDRFYETIYHESFWRMLQISYCAAVRKVFPDLKLLEQKDSRFISWIQEDTDPSFNTDCDSVPD